MFPAKILLTLLFLPEIKCEEVLEWHPLFPEFTDILFLFSIMLVGGIVRQLVIKFNLPFVSVIFLIFGGFLWGILANHNKVVRLASAPVYMNPFVILYAYLPILVFNATFSLDLAVFLKTLPQILTIGGPVTLLTAGTYGLIMRFAIDVTWTLENSVLLGVFCAPIYPTTIVHLLKRQSATTKQIAVLLQGEALFGIIMSNMAYALILSNLTYLVVRWYQYIAVLLRFIILGPFAGYSLGLATRWLIRRTYTNELTVFVVLFGAPFFVYALSERYFSGCGSISVAVLGLMMSTERTSLTKEVNNFLLEMWQAISYVMDLLLGTMIAVEAVTQCMDTITVTDHVLALLSYLLYYAIRFMCFLLFSPAISRLGYGMDLKSMIVCVWSGVKCPFSVLLVRIFMKMQINEERDTSFYFYIMMLYFYSNLINASVMRKIMDFLGLRTVSMARQLNMNHCLKHIFKMRERTIAILKMDKFLADANWDMVIEATDIKHPYHMELEMDEDDGNLCGRVCPECQNEIKQEPTMKEMKEMIREAKMRVLKAKKMFYSRQFENGMVSKEGIRILSQAVEMAMDTDEAVIEVEGLEKRFMKENFITRCIRNRVQELKRSKGTFHRPPRRYIRRLCYNIVLNKKWEKIMLVVITLNLCTIATSAFFYDWSLVKQHDRREIVVEYILVTAGSIFAFVYVLEFFMKIMAYSWVYIWQHGVRTYFKSMWNVNDFMVMVVACLALTYDVLFMVNTDMPLREFRQALNVLECFRMFRLLRLFEMFYPHVIKYLDRHVDNQLAITFELGKNYASGETEILEMLPYMIEHPKIQAAIKQLVEKDRTLVFHLLSKVQKEKPWVAITVKTKQAIRTILKSMNDAKNQLRISGWVDDYELDKLDRSMMLLYRKVNSIRTVRPSAPKIIFKEVAWMGKDEVVINYLFANVTVKKFEPGDVVFDEGIRANGIYIVVTGLFTISYNPEKKTIANLTQLGELPIVDYFSGGKFDEPCFEHIFSGNCIGELSTLTKRPYNCTITAVAHSQVYVLREDVLSNAMDLNPDPVSGLECRIWKEVAVRIAVPLLMSVAAYQNYSQDQIKYTLERAFVPNLSQSEALTITEVMQDLLLIEGVAVDASTGTPLTAPCYIPRTVQKLLLPKSSITNVSSNAIVKILVIPEKDVEKYNLFRKFDGTSELVAVSSSSRCLLHSNEQRRQRHRRMSVAAVSLQDKDDKELTEKTSESESGTMYFRSALQEVHSAEELFHRETDVRDK